MGYLMYAFGKSRCYYLMEFSHCMIICLRCYRCQRHLDFGNGAYLSWWDWTELDSRV